MKMMLVGIPALLLAAGYLPTMDTRANPEPGVNTRLTPRIAQGEVQIPSDAQLERMQERAIITSPLDVRGAPGRDLSERAEIRQMDERARRIDERLMGDGAICVDCD